MAKNIMIQGSMSNVGKSIVAAALCRILRQDGYRVAPFKSQNMALNSFISEEGGEMGRAQVVQAECAGIKPDVRMNPILLKPTSDVGSQVIVMGKVQGNMRAMEYFRHKREYIPQIMEAYNSLAAENDIIVIEGAGSPAELNLKQDDIVNMGLAKLVDAPVLLVGDIDRGGIFAQLYGTVELLDEDERQRIKGMVVNKFRGDKAIFSSAVKMLEDICKVPVAGIVPYIHVDIDDEDSLSQRFDKKTASGLINIAVIKLPRISNFTDFAPFERFENVAVNYVDKPSELCGADMIILPGTKSTIADLLWLRQSGFETEIYKAASAGTPVFGICGGMQMLGCVISDPEGLESANMQEIKGMELLKISTHFSGEKVQKQSRGVIQGVTGIFSGINGMDYSGYEIHMGRGGDEAVPVMCSGNIYGSYIHGLFDSRDISETIIRTLCEKKGLNFESLGDHDTAALKEREYNKLADAVRAGLDMDYIYKVINREV